MLQVGFWPAVQAVPQRFGGNGDLKAAAAALRAIAPVVLERGINQAAGVGYTTTRHNGEEALGLLVSLFRARTLKAVMNKLQTLAKPPRGESQRIVVQDLQGQDMVSLMKYDGFNVFFKIHGQVIPRKHPVAKLQAPLPPGRQLSLPFADFPR